MNGWGDVAEPSTPRGALWTAAACRRFESVAGSGTWQVTETRALDFQRRCPRAWTRRYSRMWTRSGSLRSSADAPLLMREPWPRRTGQTFALASNGTSSAGDEARSSEPTLPQWRTWASRVYEGFVQVTSSEIHHQRQAPFPLRSKGAKHTTMSAKITSPSQRA
jgi:hypothetical protein